MACWDVCGVLSRKASLPGVFVAHASLRGREEFSLLLLSLLRARAYPVVITPNSRALQSCWLKALDRDATRRLLCGSCKSTNQMPASDFRKSSHHGATEAFQRLDESGEKVELEISEWTSDTAWSKRPLGSAPARLLCLLRARLTALGSSSLPGRGRPTGRPATALGARACYL